MGYHSPQELWGNLTEAEWHFWVRFHRDCQWGEVRADSRQEVLIAYIVSLLTGKTDGLPRTTGPNYYPTPEEQESSRLNAISACEETKRKIESGELVLPARRKQSGG